MFIVIVCLTLYEYLYMLFFKSGLLIYPPLSQGKYIEVADNERKEVWPSCFHPGSK